jgi:hypothetical protein
LKSKGNVLPATTPPARKTAYFGQTTSTTDLGYFPFGEPDVAVFKIFYEMLDDCNVLLDLLYGAPAWTILLRHWRSLLSAPEDNTTVETSRNKE